jgi:amino acid permease
MFAAPVWHYWIGVFIFVPVMLVVVGFTIMFLRKTQSPRYGRDD